MPEHATHQHNGAETEAVARAKAAARPASGRVLGLQGTIGNRATSALISRRDALIQRDDTDPPVEAPKDGAKEPAKKDPPKAPEHPAPKHSPLTLAGAQKILTDSFGTVKKIVPGKIAILDTAGFKAAYDKVYGKTQYSWDKYVVPTYGGLNGWAHDGTNYINKDSAGLHTVVHEMLHNNTSDEFATILGSRFNEGMTEVLTQDSCAVANEDAPTSYPGESPVVKYAFEQGLSKADTQAAYFGGGVKAKVADWIDANCTDNFATFKANFESKDWAAAKASLTKKKA